MSVTSIFKLIISQMIAQKCRLTNCLRTYLQIQKCRRCSFSQKNFQSALDVNKIIKNFKPILKKTVTVRNNGHESSSMSHVQLIFYYILPLFFTGPLGGVTGRLPCTPLYGNFFLSAGLRICHD